MSTCICGKDIPPATGRGRPSQFCCERCANRARKQRQREREHVTEIRANVTEIRKVERILPYPGAKWNLAPWITSFFPPHRVYLEPYAGSAAVFFSKAPASHEVLGDVNGDIANFFQVLIDHGPELITAIARSPWSESEFERCQRTPKSGDPVEDARRFVVRIWQSHGTKLGRPGSWRHLGPKGSAETTALWSKLPQRLDAAAIRLRMAEIRNRPALELIEYYNVPDCLIYCDPPYVLSTRLSSGHYSDEMTDADHLALLDALEKHTGPVVLSGYAHPLYDERLAQWQRVMVSARAEHGRQRTEVLWLNPKAKVQQQSLFAV